GSIGTYWALKDGRFNLTVTIPPNTSAHVFVPAQDRKNVESPGEARFLKMEGKSAAFEVAGGTWRFRSSQV
ncbi:MAG: alpha-L-rhamnosidase C-terminal domain-containing protein, partial [bacterium]